MFDFIQMETNLRKLNYLGFEKFPVHVLEISSLVTDSQMRSVTPFISTNKIHHACLNFSLIKSEIHIYWRDPNKNFKQLFCFVRQNLSNLSSCSNIFFWLYDK